MCTVYLHTGPELVEEYLCRRWQMKSAAATESEKYRNLSHAHINSTSLLCVYLTFIEMLPPLMLLLLPRKEKLILLAWYACCDNHKHTHTYTHTYIHTRTHTYVYWPIFCISFNILY